jgi:hypothetical protein
MPQDTLNEAHGQTSRARNQKALHTSDGNSPHSHYTTKKEPEDDNDQIRGVCSTMSEVKKSKSSKSSSSGSSSNPSSLRSRKTSSKDSSAPKKSEEELLARFRAVSSPSDFYLTDSSRDGVMATNLSTRLANVDKVNPDNGLGYGKQRTHAAEAKDTRVRSIEEVNINQVLGSGTGELNADETNDRSIAALLMIAKASSQPTSKPVCRA